MGVPNDNTIKPKQMGPVATAALGIGTQMVSGLGNQIFGEMNQARELRGQRKALAQQNAAAMDIWEKTNYKAQMGQLEKAGLNPGLIYGMGGAGGTLGGSSATAQGAAGTGAMDIAGAAQIALLNAQRENIEADTENKRADKGKKEAETPGAIADSTMKSQEAESRKGWTKVMSETYGSELEARQALAKTTYDLWVDGKLKDGAEAEIAAKLKANAKTDEEIKAIQQGIDKMKVDIQTGKLNNEILELEKEMQTELGIDKNSPVWMKMIGRLIIKYFK